MITALECEHGVLHIPLTERNSTRKWWEPYDTLLFTTGEARTVKVEETAANCGCCERTVLISEYEANPSILDGWDDCGEEAYCPKCTGSEWK